MLSILLSYLEQQYCSPY